MRRLARQTRRWIIIPTGMGLVVTVLIAWTSAVIGQPGQFDAQRTAEHRRAFWDSLETRPLLSQFSDPRHVVDDTWIVGVWPGTICDVVKSTYSDDPRITDVEVLAGWPMRAMRGSVQYPLRSLQERTAPRGRNAIVLDYKLTLQFEPMTELVIPASVYDRPFPLQPIWLGMVVNTLLFAASIAALLLAFLALRSSIRWGRGACARCGYALRGDRVRGCPECGWRRENQ